MIPGTYIRTPETLEKQRKANLGKKLSSATANKIREKMLSLGIKPPTLSGSSNGNWKGGPAYCLDCGKELSYRHYKRCKSCSKKGNLNPYYQLILKEFGKVGIYKEIKRKIRNSYKYRQWRCDVLTRDNFICQLCGDKNKIVEVHHIVSLASIIRKYNILSMKEASVREKIWDINNGQTLCLDCHSTTNNYKGRTGLFNRDKVTGLFIESSN